MLLFIFCVILLSAGWFAHIGIRAIDRKRVQNRIGRSAETDAIHAKIEIESGFVIGSPAIQKLEADIDSKSELACAQEGAARATVSKRFTEDTKTILGWELVTRLDFRGILVQHLSDGTLRDATFFVTEGETVTHYAADAVLSKNPDTFYVGVAPQRKIDWHQTAINVWEKHTGENFEEAIETEKLAEELKKKLASLQSMSDEDVRATAARQLWEAEMIVKQAKQRVETANTRIEKIKAERDQAIRRARTNVYY